MFLELLKCMSASFVFVFQRSYFWCYSFLQPPSDALCMQGVIVSTFRALLSILMALLSVCRALLSIFTTLLSVCRALLCRYSICMIVYMC